MLSNPVILSVLIMTVLCLLKVNVLVSIIVAALAGGLFAGMPLLDTMGILIGGMGKNAETALAYIFLGALAIAIEKTGVAEILVIKISRLIKTKKNLFILLIAGIASLSQNLIPVHIAFIPILIPPLLSLMNRLKMDRRAVACALTFGLKTPYVMIPVGFGLMFHNIIRDAIIDNGIMVETGMVWRAMLLPGIGMIIGLLVAVFITYKKPREYSEVSIEKEGKENQVVDFTREHFAALVGAVGAFVIQLISKSLPLAALVGLILMTLLGAFRFSELDDVINGGIGLMGFIAFVMLVAAGYGEVLRSTGGVESLVDVVTEAMPGGQIVAAFSMLVIGLIITMGIGTSFGTIPIIATIFVPLGVELGFSTAGIIALIGTAGALGDAGSPASDSTLGPTSGLNADGAHNHISDTCVPTFLHFNIPLIIFGSIASIIL